MTFPTRPNEHYRRGAGPEFEMQGRLKMTVDSMKHFTEEEYSFLVETMGLVVPLAEVLDFLETTNNDLLVLRAGVPEQRLMWKILRVSHLDTNMSPMGGNHIVGPTPKNTRLVLDAKGRQYFSMHEFYMIEAAATLEIPRTDVEKTLKSQMEYTQETGLVFFCSCGCDTPLHQCNDWCHDEKSPNFAHGELTVDI